MARSQAGGPPSLQPVALTQPMVLPQVSACLGFFSAHGVDFVTPALVTPALGVDATRGAALSARDVDPAHRVVYAGGGLRSLCLGPTIGGVWCHRAALPCTRVGGGACRGGYAASPNEDSREDLSLGVRRHGQSPSRAVVGEKGCAPDSAADASQEAQTS